MPTAARLVAAILFAGLFWIVSQAALPLFALAEQPDPRGFAMINTVAGLLLGWRLGGDGAGRNRWSGAVGQGLTTMIATAFVALFLHALIRMVALSMRKHYDGPAEAVIGVFALMIEMGRTMATPEVISLLLAGAVLLGLVVEWVGRRAN